MGAFGEALNGARLLADALGGLPWVCLRILRSAQTPEAARDMLGAHFLRALTRQGVRVELRGTPPEPGTGCVLCYNETALPDVIAFNACMWRHIDIAAGADIYGWLPFLRRAGDKIGIVLVARGNRSATENLLEQMVAAVKAGKRVSWGGEGRLSGHDGVGHFKRGAALIAIKSGAPVIPVTIHGGHAIMPLRSLRARGGVIRIHFGPPISSAGYSEDTVRELTDRVREQVQETYLSLASAAS